MKQNHNKLVRDRIPEIIKNSGNQCEISILSTAEYQVSLREKVIEEAREVAAASSSEELVKEIADLYEVIDALVTVMEIDKAAIIQKQKQRREERGGFQKRIKLISTSFTPYSIFEK